MIIDYKIANKKKRFFLFDFRFSNFFVFKYLFFSWVEKKIELG